MRAQNFLAPLWIGLCGCAAPVQAQVASPATATRLSLGISSGTSEAEVEVPVNFAPAGGVEVGKVEAQISFPSQTLSFVKVSGYLASQQAVKIKTDVRTGKKPGDGVLDLSLESANAARPLPAGVLTNVLFTVAKDAKPEILSLGIQAKAWLLGDPPRELKPPEIEVYEGRINIQEPEVFFGCFFYMH